MATDEQVREEQIRLESLRTYGHHVAPTDLTEDAVRARLDAVHYRQTVRSLVACGAHASVAESITTTAEPALVTCGACRVALNDPPEPGCICGEAYGARPADVEKCTYCKHGAP